MSEEINYRQLLQQQLVKIRKLEARLEQARTVFHREVAWLERLAPSES